jgi:hypothetical protein
VKLIKPAIIVATLLSAFVSFELLEDFQGRSIFVDEVGLTIRDFDVEVVSVFANGSGRGVMAEGIEAQKIFDQIVAQNRMTKSRGQGEDYPIRELMMREFKIDDTRPIYIASRDSFIGVSLKDKVLTLVRIRL